MFLFIFVSRKLKSEVTIYQRTKWHFRNLRFSIKIFVARHTAKQSCLITFIRIVPARRVQDIAKHKHCNWHLFIAQITALSIFAKSKRLTSTPLSFRLRVIYILLNEMVPSPVSSTKQLLARMVFSHRIAATANRARPLVQFPSIDNSVFVASKFIVGTLSFLVTRKRGETTKLVDNGL